MVWWMAALGLIVAGVCVHLERQRFRVDQEWQERRKRRQADDTE